MVEYRKFDIEFTESSLKDSRFDQTRKYSQVEANDYHDYFVFRVQSKPEKFLSVNMVSDREMTIAEYKTREDIIDGESTDYAAFEKVHCKSEKKRAKQ